MRALPGIGGYTAGAIAAIAYDEKQAAMDANAERVIARLYAVETPMPKAKPELHALGQALVPDRAGDFAQALMDLGSRDLHAQAAGLSAIARGMPIAWRASAASRNSCRSRRRRWCGR